MFLYQLNMGIDFCLPVIGDKKTRKCQMNKQVKRGPKTSTKETGGEGL